MRWQEWLYGDLMAQLGSIWTGKRRLIELASHYGNDEVERYVEAIFDYADQRMAEEIRQMPDGDYEGTSWLDTDGQGGTDIPVNARVSIRDDRVHVDFGGSAPQTPGANNSSFGVMQAAAGIPILCTIDPSIPHNDGCLRHITAEAPLGSVCNAQYPASTALATIGPDDTMQDAVYKALAHAVPERVTGGNGRVSCVPFFSGTDTRDGQDRSWGCMFFNGGPAGGASSKQDGWPLLITSAGMGGLKILSVEMSELLYPMRVDKQEIGADSMGHGEHHGGPGVEIQITPIGGPIECHLFGDGTANPPHGVMGGTIAIGGGSYKENLETGKRTYCSSKGRLMIEENEVWVAHSSGGGGYGDPLKRDPEAVLESIFEGLLTVECAAEVYGVVINKATMTIDRKRTEGRREKMAAERGPARGGGADHARRLRLGPEAAPRRRRIPDRPAVTGRARRNRTMARLNTFDADAGADSVAAAIERDGYAIVRGLLDPENLARLSDDLAPHLEATALGDPDDFMGAKTKRFGALLSRCPTSRDMVVHPLVLEIADRVLGPYCARYRIHYTGVMQHRARRNCADHAPGHRPPSRSRTQRRRSRSRPCGRSATSRRRTERPASCRAATAGPTTGFRSRTRSRRRKCRRARC